MHWHSGLLLGRVALSDVAYSRDRHIPYAREGQYKFGGGNGVAHVT